MTGGRLDIQEWVAAGWDAYWSGMHGYSAQRFIAAGLQALHYVVAHSVNPNEVRQAEKALLHIQRAFDCMSQREKQAL